MTMCLQLKDPWASILPFDGLHSKSTVSGEQLHKIQDMEQKGIIIEKYMEEPMRKYGSSEFVVRVVFSLSIPLQEILEDDKVQSWFRQERVQMEENLLAAAHPTNVGFL